MINEARGSLLMFLQFISRRCQHGEKIQAQNHNEKHPGQVEVRAVVPKCAEDEIEIINVMSCCVALGGVSDEGAPVMISELKDVGARRLCG